MKTVVWAVLAAVLAGALGFYGGVTYQKTQTPTFTRGAGQGGFGGFGGGQGGAAGGQGRGGAGRFGGGITTGTVIAQDATSLTVKTAAGGSKTVFISSQTSVSKQQVLTPSDIKVGDQVAAIGQTANGGVDARVIQIVPPGGTFRFGGGFGGGGNGGGAPGGPGAPGAPGGGSSSGQ